MASGTKLRASRGVIQAYHEGRQLPFYLRSQLKDDSRNLSPHYGNEPPMVKSNRMVDRSALARKHWS